MENKESSKIKSFIYLDEDKMYSISSQLFEGMTQYILQEETEGQNDVNRAHPTNPVECCADANPKTMLPNDT